MNITGGAAFRQWGRAHRRYDHTGRRRGASDIRARGGRDGERVVYFSKSYAGRVRGNARVSLIMNARRKLT